MLKSADNSLTYIALRPSDNNNILSYTGNSVIIQDAKSTDEFKFTKVLNFESHEQLYKEIFISNPEISKFIHSIINGYQLTYVCFGLPNSGKSYALFGTPGLQKTQPESRGLIYRTFSHLIDLVSKITANFKIHISFWHIFSNGQIADLFDTKLKDLKLIKNEPNNCFDVDGITKCEIHNDQDLIRMLDRGILIRNATSLLVKEEVITYNEDYQFPQPSSNYKKPHSTHAFVVLTISAKNHLNSNEISTIGKVTFVDISGKLFLESLTDETSQPQSLEIKHFIEAANKLPTSTNSLSEIFLDFKDDILGRLLSQTLDGSHFNIFLGCILSDQLAYNKSILQFLSNLTQLPIKPRQYSTITPLSNNRTSISNNDQAFMHIRNNNILSLPSNQIVIHKDAITSAKDIITPLSVEPKSSPFFTPNFLPSKLPSDKRITPHPNKPTTKVINVESSKLQSNIPKTIISNNIPLSLKTPKIQIENARDLQLTTVNINKDFKQLISSKESILDITDSNVSIATGNSNFDDSDSSSPQIFNDDVTYPHVNTNYTNSPYKPKIINVESETDAQFISRFEIRMEPPTFKLSINDPMATFDVSTLSSTKLQPYQLTDKDKSSLSSQKSSLTDFESKGAANPNPNIFVRSPTRIVPRLSAYSPNLPPVLSTITPPPYPQPLTPSFPGSLGDNSLTGSSFRPAIRSNQLEGNNPYDVAASTRISIQNSPRNFTQFPNLAPDYSFASMEIGPDEIHLAMLEGTTREKLRGLVVRYGIDFPDSGGRTPLMYAILGNQTKAIKELLSMGASANKFDISGFTPLLWAVYFGRLQIMKILLKHGCDPIICDKEGRTIFHWATKLPSTDCLTELVENSIDFLVNQKDIDELTALHWAVMCDQPNHLKILLRDMNADVYQTDLHGRTALNYSVLTYSLRCIKVILDYDKMIADFKDAKGRIPLHYASGEGILNCVRALLLQSNTNLNNVIDNDGRTPLHWAAAANQCKVTQLLLKKGVPRQLRDNEGMTALDYAISRKHGEVISLLQADTILRIPSAFSLLSFSSNISAAQNRIPNECGHFELNKPTRKFSFSNFSFKSFTLNDSIIADDNQIANIPSSPNEMRISSQIDASCNMMTPLLLSEECADLHDSIERDLSTPRLITSTFNIASNINKPIKMLICSCLTHSPNDVMESNTAEN